MAPAMTAPAIYTGLIGSDAGPGFFQCALPLGSRSYYAKNNDGILPSFDFATGAVCPGFTYTGTNFRTTTGVYAYTIISDPTNPTCIWEDGDKGVLLPINAITGAVGCSTVGTVTATPTASYCDGQSHPISWQGI